MFTQAPTPVRLGLRLPITNDRHVELRTLLYEILILEGGKT